MSVEYCNAMFFFSTSLECNVYDNLWFGVELIQFRFSSYLISFEENKEFCVWLDGSLSSFWSPFEFYFIKKSYV